MSIVRRRAIVEAHSAPSAIAEISVITLGARVRRARIIAEIDRLIEKRLDPEPSGECRRQHDAGVRDKPLVVKRDRHSIRRDPLWFTMWVTS